MLLFCLSVSTAINTARQCKYSPNCFSHCEFSRELEQEVFVQGQEINASFDDRYFWILSGNGDDESCFELQQRGVYYFLFSAEAPDEISFTWHPGKRVSLDEIQVPSRDIVSMNGFPFSGNQEYFSILPHSVCKIKLRPTKGGTRKIMTIVSHVDGWDTIFDQKPFSEHGAAYLWIPSELIRLWIQTRFAKSSDSCSRLVGIRRRDLELIQGYEGEPSQTIA